MSLCKLILIMNIFTMLPFLSSCDISSNNDINQVVDSNCSQVNHSTLSKEVILEKILEEFFPVFLPDIKDEENKIKYQKELFNRYNISVNNSVWDLCWDLNKNYYLESCTTFDSICDDFNIVSHLYLKNKSGIGRVDFFIFILFNDDYDIVFVDIVKGDVVDVK